jgi:hypothetical protein
VNSQAQYTVHTLLVVRGGKRKLINKYPCWMQRTASRERTIQRDGSGRTGQEFFLEIELGILSSHPGWNPVVVLWRTPKELCTTEKGKGSGRAWEQNC